MLAYTLGVLGIARNPDAVTIGALMLLVPGLLFINAMRDIIYGDTNSGVNRIVQVFLVAAALSLGTGAAWSICSRLWGAPVNLGLADYNFATQCLLCFLGCIGFSILFNVHDLGVTICALGGTLVWAVYLITEQLTGSSYFFNFCFQFNGTIRNFKVISFGKNSVCFTIHFLSNKI